MCKLTISVPKILIRNYVVKVILMKIYSITIVSTPFAFNLVTTKENHLVYLSFVR